MQAQSAKYLLALASAALLACAFSSVVAASTSLPRLLGDGPHGRLAWQVRPSSIGYTGDGSGILGGFDGKAARHALHPGHLTWASWTPSRATGSGAVWIDDCTPSCAQGKFTAHAVRVAASRPVKGHFTRLTLHYRYHGKRQTDKRGITRIGGAWSYYIVGSHP